MANKKIGILTSGGDCGGLNAAIRSIFYRAKNKYNMDVYGIKDGTAGLIRDLLPPFIYRIKPLVVIF